MGQRIPSCSDLISNCIIIWTCKKWKIKEIYKISHAHQQFFKRWCALTAGLAPSVKNKSFGLAGKPSRASIPAAMVSRNPLIPWFNIILPHKIPESVIMVQNCSKLHNYLAMTICTSCSSRNLIQDLKCSLYWISTKDHTKVADIN